MDNIYAAAENISEYEVLLMDIEAINQEYTNLMNQSIGALESRDSIPLDSVKLYLEAFNDLWSNIRLIYFALEENNFTYSQQRFENLGNISDETNEISDYSTLYNNVLVDIYTNHEGDFYQMNESQKNDLYDIFTNGTYAAGIAKYLLMKYDDLEWAPNYCEGGNSDERRAKPEIISETTNQIITIYPNPANDRLNIVITDELITPTEISILDLSGRIVKILIIKSQNSQINISDLSEGIYFVRFYVNDEITTQKLVITK
ncbi:MAG: hypothetical protein AUJ98_03145 [Bacteroidetes bacterium CG2_30_33_31]|nr:MAG: hypothetical protein AUJ98_03145 [Bacteroidetes bacterium CG2_30_33_31]